MKRFWYGLIIAIAGFINCSKQQLKESERGSFITYVIPANEQFSRPNDFQTFNSDTISFIAIFDSSCIYKTIDTNNQYDINKLFGFSDCNSHHLVNSARVGWRWSNDSLRLFAFVHYNRNILYKEMTTAQIAIPVTCMIVCDGNDYVFTINNTHAVMPRYCNQKGLGHYLLYPYFGGDEKSPHNIFIKIAMQ